MDGRRFDDLARVFASGVSRRATLNAALGAGVAALVAPLIGRRSRAYQQRCLSDGDCPTSSRCCGSVCRDVLNDLDHCGGCESPCPPGPSMLCCDGLCADAATSRNHCGGCDRPCGDEVCVDGACCTPAAVCFGSCCAAGEVCFPPSAPLPPNPSTPVAFPESPAPRGICCPPRQVCDDFCCPTGEECAVAESDLVCCPVDRICVVAQDSLECCARGEVCYGALGCGPAGQGGEATGGNATGGDVPTPAVCVPRRKRSNLRAGRAPFATSGQDPPEECVTDADCCEEGDVCDDGECVPAEEGEGAVVSESLDLSPFIPLPSELGPDFGITGGTMVVAPEGLAELGYGADLIAALAPGFRGAYQVFYTIPAGADGAADISVGLLAVGFASTQGAAAGIEVFFGARPAEAVDQTRGDEGDKGYTIEYPFQLGDGTTGTVLESGAYLADVARVVVTRTAFSGDALASTDPAARAQRSSLYAAAFRQRLTILRKPDGHPPGAALLFGALPAVSWRPLALINEVLPQPGETPEQLALRASEFRNAESALGVNYLFGGDRYRLGNRLVVYPNPDDGQTAIATYPDYFAELIVSQGLTGERIDPPVVFGDQTAFYRFVIATDEGAVPGLTMAGLFSGLPGALAPPALLVTVSLRDQQAVAADDRAAIEGAQAVLGESLARIAPVYADLIRAFPYDAEPKVFTVAIDGVPPAEGTTDDEGATTRDSGAATGDVPVGDLLPDFAYNSALWTELGGEYGYLQVVGGTFPQLEAAGFFDLSTVADSGAQIQTASVVRFARPVTPGLTSTSPLGLGAGFEAVSLLGTTPGDIDLVLPILQTFPTFGRVVDGSDVGIPNDIDVTYGALDGGAVVSALSRLGSTALLITMFDFEGGQAELNDARRLTGEWWQRSFDVQESGQPTLGLLVPRFDGAAREAYFGLAGDFAPASPAAEESLFLQDRVRLGDYFSLNLGVRADVFERAQETEDGAALNFSFSDMVSVADASKFLSGLPDHLAGIASEKSLTLEIEVQTDETFSYRFVEPGSQGSRFGLDRWTLLQNQILGIRLTVPTTAARPADVPVDCRDALRDAVDRATAAFPRRTGAVEESDIFQVNRCIVF